MEAGAPQGEAQMRRILVIANRTCPCEPLSEEIVTRAARGPTEVLIVAPALNSRIRHLFSDADAAVAAAEERLAATVESLRQSGVRATGGVGDADPAQALEDALREFPAEELIISTHPAGLSHWLERGLLERAQERFAGPVTHIVSRYGLDTAGSTH